MKSATHTPTTYILQKFYYRMVTRIRNVVSDRPLCSPAWAWGLNLWSPEMHYGLHKIQILSLPPRENPLRVALLLVESALVIVSWLSTPRLRRICCWTCSHQMAALFCVKWRHGGRHLESMVSLSEIHLRQSMRTWRTIVPNIILVRFTTEP